MFYLRMGECVPTLYNCAGPPPSLGAPIDFHVRNGRPTAAHDVAGRSERRGRISEEANPLPTPGGGSRGASDSSEQIYDSPAAIDQSPDTETVRIDSVNHFLYLLSF